MMMAGCGSDAPVKRHGDFHQDERPLVLAPEREAFVEAAGFGFASRRWSTSNPGRRSRSAPWPATAGLGSMVAATTRLSPAAISASVQGGCGRCGCRVPA